MTRPAPVTEPMPAQQAEGAWAAKMERLRRRATPRSTLRISDDDELRRALTEAEAQARRARLFAEATPDDAAATARAAEADAALAEARSMYDAASDTLTFLALPRPVLEELIGRHPPTDEQAAEGAVFNPDTFPPALISAASSDGMSREEAAELLATWPAAEANLLWEAAWQVQQESRVELGKD
ncbi:hypothetical protein [Streptomyces fractus]|uniref:hypothetical protein n=1 Tax=Streptomyces fractus TaxID=641806 RepID=UPI003CF124FC